MSHPTTDLSFATMDELVSEIQKRTEFSLILCLMPDKCEGKPGIEALYWSGPMSGCLGLAVKAQHRLLRQIDLDSEAGETE